ncbi:MAG: DUF4404 family protein [Gammaproteobacteria bacterium]|jgi:hypothetical protein|nr:DUF4404 family protein [Gammaproteobacteria bacterium]
MPSSKLRESLESIRRELDEPGAVDDANRALLEQVAADIERVLDEEDETTPDTVRGKMEKAAVDFEAEHPRLARVMNEIVDALGRMGI